MANIEQKIKAPILKLRKNFDTPRKDFARLLGISERSLAGLEQGKKPTPPMQRKIRELIRLYEALVKVVHADFVSGWLQEPNTAFNNLKPLEVVERGETDRIWKMIYYLESGIAS
ncbi:MAG: helix-turn-helix domain-containing protein [Kiritimatiellae bacterium]|nr:helix-turn-helix domain-containing protein [Kiritimatiellia bacterium]